MERTFTEELESYNEAVRYASEVERLKAEGNYVSEASRPFCDSPKNQLSDIQKAVKTLRSKVCTIANRLSSHMDRTTAFIQAWTIVKAGSLELAVKGVSFGNRQEALRRLASYDPTQVRAVLVPEPSNPVDPFAIAVMVGIQGGRGLYRLGYIPRNLTQVVTALDGRIPALRVVSGTWGWFGKTTYGARLALAV